MVSVVSQIARSGRQRLVIKIGSALIAAPEEGLRQSWIDSVAADIADLKAGGSDVILVSSGAISLGLLKQGLQTRPSSLADAQAAACVGQIALMQAFTTAFAAEGIAVGQLLLTLADLDGRRTYLNARETLETLLQLGHVPVINENDATATEEIRVGDNDRLAARVAQMVSADQLILLSDIDGLYTANPKSDPAAQHIPKVEAITDDVISLAAPLDPASLSRGGMLTKLQAGQLAAQSGCEMIIMSGQALNPLKRLQNGERHTWFQADRNKRKSARSTWLAGQLHPHGSVMVDEGAAQALKNGSSLLAAGITGIEGAFGRAENIEVLGPSGAVLAIGLSNYDSTEIDRIKGLKSEDIATVLGYTRSQTVVHRDNLVMKNMTRQP